MKLKHYKKYTFKVCMAFRFKHSKRNTNRLILNLTKWSKVNDESGEYPSYTGDLGMIVHYCSDRMNSGRAKAILKLMKGNGYESIPHA